jgi:hypothetical protein
VNPTQGHHIAWQYTVVQSVFHPGSEWIGHPSLWRVDQVLDEATDESCDRVSRRVEFELCSLIIIPLSRMSDLYTSLHISPRKKRFLSDDEDDTCLTPKRLRPGYVNHLPLSRRFSSDGDKVHSRLQRRLKQIGQRLRVPLKPPLILSFLHICHDSSRFRPPCNMPSPMLLPHPLSHPPPKLGFCET